jgi:hypothetical protein
MRRSFEASLNVFSRYLLLAALGAALSARAADTAEPAHAHVHAPASAGLRVYIDPDTGEKLEKPKTAAHRAIADDLPRRDDAKMKAVVVPGVGVMMKAAGQLQMTEFVHRGADGKLSSDCVQSAAPRRAEDAR